jgi:hypothetical protein
MRIKSPLSNLSDTINQVKESAAQYRETLRRNEAATRAVLIDPVLQALGWDTANTYMVEVEKSLEQTRVDYALYDHNASVRIVVEAKALGSDLNDRTVTMNMVKYAFTYGIQDIFLTDGLVWEHITTIQPGNIDRKVVDFRSDNPVDSAVYLVQRLDAARFWPEEQTIDVLAQKVGQLESALASLQKEVSQLTALQQVRPTLTKPSPPTIPLPLPTGPSTISADQVFVDLDTIVDVTGKKPSFLRLPDGAVVNTSSWGAVLRECCKFALANNPHIPIPLPDRAGRKVRLFDAVKPPTGISFVTEDYNGGTIYIYVNYDANNSVANAVHVLNQVPQAAKKAKAGVVFSQVSKGASKDAASQA